MSQRSLEWSGTWALGQLGSKNPFNKLRKFKLFIGFGWESISLSLSLSAIPTSCRTYKLMISAKNFLPLTVTVAMVVTATVAMATAEEVGATVRVRVGTFGK